MHTLSDVLKPGLRVLIRVDFNVPIEHGVVVDDRRIRASLPVIKQALDGGAAVLLMSHLGRPTEGTFAAELSLAPVAEVLGSLLGQAVTLLPDWPYSKAVVAPGEVALCENVRFNIGEKADDEALARRMAEHCDVFVMDAFATAHRAQASTHGIARFAPVACAGPLLQAELQALARVMQHPKRPLVAIVGGAKISTKLPLLKALAEQVDSLIVGGGIANTLLAAQGQPVGASLYESDLVEEAKAILAYAQVCGCQCVLPRDVVVATEVTADAHTRVVDNSAVTAEDRILDVGPESCAEVRDIILQAGTVLWNGPLGLFELAPFATGTEALAQAIADSPAYSVAGGGDTLAAAAAFGISDKISYISTGGGAFLSYVQGEELPAVAVLQVDDSA